MLCSLIITNQKICLPLSPSLRENLRYSKRITVNGRDASALIDTGSMLSALTPDLFQQLVKDGVKSEKTDLMIRGIGDQTSNSTSKLSTNISFDSGVQRQITFISLSLPGGYDCLIGMDFLSEHGAFLACDSKNIVFSAREGSRPHVVALEDTWHDALPVCVDDDDLLAEGKYRIPHVAQESDYAAASDLLDENQCYSDDFWNSDACHDDAKLGNSIEIVCADQYDHEFDS